MSQLAGKTIIVTGASRGIGREIALKCAADGANIVIAAKSAEPHPKLPGTIFTVAEEVEQAGGKALAFQVDVREESIVESMCAKAAETFGGIDALINNAGAIALTDVESTTMKRADLMHQVNARAAYLCAKAALPYLKKSSHAHIINMSPPITLEPHWLANHVAYTISKYGMSLAAIGMAEEFKNIPISVNALWPKTAIATAAINMLLGETGMKQSRTPAIVADAAHALLCTPPGKVTGQLLLDEDILRDECGITDFKHYRVDPDVEPLPDLYVKPWNI